MGNQDIKHLGVLVPVYLVRVYGICKATGMLFLLYQVYLLVPQPNYVPAYMGLLTIILKIQGDSSFQIRYCVHQLVPSLVFS